MRLDLTGRNVDITPTLRQLLSRKLSRLERLLRDSAVSAQVVLSRERHRHITDITLHARGDNMLTGVGTAASWPESMGAAVEKITQQGQRVKGKWTARKRRAPGAAPVPEGLPVDAVIAAPGASPDEPERRRYPIRRHTLEAATARLERSPEPFVLFRHVDSQRLTLLYRHRDGRLAVIEPGA